MRQEQPLKPMETAFLADVCKALSHPARIRILNHLLSQERCACGKIVDILPLAQSTVSQHIRILKKAGLVIDLEEGRKTCYCVNRDLISKFNGFLKTMLENGKGRDLS